MTISIFQLSALHLLLMIRASHIYKSFEEVSVLNDINFEVNQGEIAAITGKSGAGKSTLLHILGTLERPDKGEVLIDGQNILQFKGNKLSNFRNNSLGFIFQFHHLLPEFNAIENVCIPALIRGDNYKDANERAAELLNFLGLSHRLNHKPKELSGGEQQRVAFARAMINNPKVVLADEPTGNLDEKTAEELHNLIFKFRAEAGQTFVIVTHNLSLAGRCDREFKMS